jgi:hypothetical protein
LLGFLCFYKRKNQAFLLARNRDFISFFLGLFLAGFFSVCQ